MVLEDKQGISLPKAALATPLKESRQTGLFDSIQASLTTDQDLFVAKALAPHNSLESP
jgi:hypothetical protein